MIIIWKPVWRKYYVGVNCGKALSEAWHRDVSEVLRIRDSAYVQTITMIVVKESCYQPKVCKSFHLDRVMESNKSEKQDRWRSFNDFVVNLMVVECVLICLTSKKSLWNSVIITATLIRRKMYLRELIVSFWGHMELIVSFWGHMVAECVEIFEIEKVCAPLL